ncbi:MAG: hypothetical protein GX589_08685 [Deltaproteobacteria bacterium]|nr:hypothetical protein [Deltaproteobacteria bacterium]
MCRGLVGVFDAAYWRGLPAPRDGEGLRRCVSVGLRAGGASGPGGGRGVRKERGAILFLLSPEKVNVQWIGGSLRCRVSAGSSMLRVGGTSWPGW